jgi:hypothetical protein
MRQCLVLFLIFWAGFLIASELEQSEVSKHIVRTVHRVRNFIEKPGKVLDQDRELLKTQIGLLAKDENGLKEFAKYLYGPGLLYSDEFYGDLIFLLEQIQEGGRGAKSQLDELDFFPFAQSLAKVSLGEPLDSVQAKWEDFEVAASAVLLADDRFHETSRVIKGRVRLAQSAVVFILGGYAVQSAWNFLGVGQMTPKEFVGFLLSVWAGNEALYWLAWEKFQWIDPITKWGGKNDYDALSDAWTKLLALDPKLTAQKAASAATTKLLSNQKHADPHSDAALEALVKSLRFLPASETDLIRGELFEMFLTGLEDGNASRSLTILKALRDHSPHSRAARMSEVVARIFRLGIEIERICRYRQSLRASVRLVTLGMVVFGSNNLLKSLLPADLQQWRLVPNWVLTGLGVRRIFPHVWKPHRLEALRRVATDQEVAIREAFRELMEIDPSGEVIERIVKYDSGAPAHRLVGFAAGDALAEHPNGERTRKLWNLVSWELSTPHPSGSRVQDLLSKTFAAQGECVRRLVDVFKSYGAPPPID